MKHIVAIIQARTGSVRLSKKVLMDLAGQTMLERVVHRVSLAKTIDSVVVATTDQERDNLIVNLGREKSFFIFRGKEDDVLDRYYRTAIAFKADTIVRITSDCPLIDPHIIDKVVLEFVSSNVDYASNFIKRTYPRGLDCEVMSFKTLKKAWDEDLKWREHVTPYIYNNPDKFSITSIKNDVDYSRMRWTVDTNEDLEFVRKIYNHFGDNDFSWRDVLQLLDEHLAWQNINKNIEQKVV